jgi:hypothetical protein
MASRTDRVHGESRANERTRGRLTDPRRRSRHKRYRAKNRGWGTQRRSGVRSLAVANLEHGLAATAGDSPQWAKKTSRRVSGRRHRRP